jgi:hypothetical protein
MKNNFVKHFLVFLLIAISGMPFFIQFEIPVLLLLNLILAFFLLVNKIKLKKIYFKFIFFFFIITFIHYVLLGEWSPRTIFGIFARINAGYLVFVYLNKDFKSIFIKQILFLSCLSLIFMTINILTPSLYELMSAKSFQDDYYATQSILIYTFSESIRNNGPFWEPGVFAGYIIVGLLFYHINSNRINLKDRTAQVLIITLITTFSTTGYLALLILFFALNVVLKYKKRNLLLKSSVVLIFAISIFYLTTNLSFIANKIAVQYEEAMEYQNGNLKYTSARFINIIRDVNQITEKPYFGWGFTNETRLINESDYFANITVGTTDLLVRLGFIGFSLFTYALFLGLRSYGITKNYAILMLFTIYFLAMSEVYFRFSFFIALPFLTNKTLKN